MICKTKGVRRLLFYVFALIIITPSVYAQQSQLNLSQQFRLGDRIIRIAEPGQIADSINVWGDVASSGRYLIPKGTHLVELMSYAGGMISIRDGQTNLDWSKMRVEIYVHQYNSEKQKVDVTTFKYRFEEPFPEEMWSFKVENNQTITVRVKRKPSFRDYLGVFASTVTAIASTVILLDRLRN